MLIHAIRMYTCMYVCKKNFCQLELTKLYISYIFIQRYTNFFKSSVSSSQLIHLKIEINLGGKYRTPRVEPNQGIMFFPGGGLFFWFGTSILSTNQ